MRYNISIFVLTLLVSSCSPEPSFYLELENADKIIEDTEININGFKIGFVQNVRVLESGRLIAEVIQSEKLNIPFDSKFIISNSSLFGESKEIEVLLGESKRIITSTDTLKATLNPIGSKADSTINKHLEEIITSFGEALDTLISEDVTTESPVANNSQKANASDSVNLKRNASNKR